MQTAHLMLASLVVGTLLSSVPAIAVEKKVPGGGIPDLMLGNPTVKEPTVEASNTLDCGDKSYKVTTGTDDGSCEYVVDSTGKTIGMRCTDASETNIADATCGKGCGYTSGSGDCQKK